MPPLSAKINKTIALRNSELCRDRTAAILLAELDNQYQNYYNPSAQIGNVYIERTNPIDFTEMSCIDVSLETDTFSAKNYAGAKTAAVIINVDVYVRSETTDAQRGDSAARIKCTRLLNIIDYILDDPQYKTLAFPPGFINGISVESISMADPEKWDAQNLTQGRVVLSVLLTEKNSLIDGVPLESSITSALIGLSGKGLRYVSGDDGPAPPLNPNFVYIVDQDGNVLQLVPGGQTYTVTVLTGILQTLQDAPTTIIQNII